MTEQFVLLELAQDGMADGPQHEPVERIQAGVFQPEVWVAACGARGWLYAAGSELLAARGWCLECAQTGKRAA